MASRNPLKPCGITHLPTDVTYLLATCLGLNDLWSLNNTSRGWRASLDSEGLWRRALLNDAPHSDIAQGAQDRSIDWRQAAERLCLRRNAIRNAAPYHSQNDLGKLPITKFGKHICFLDETASMVYIANTENRVAQLQFIAVRLPVDHTSYQVELSSFNDGVLSYHVQCDCCSGHGETVFVQVPSRTTSVLQGRELRCRHHGARPLVVVHTAERFAVLYDAQGSSKPYICTGYLHTNHCKADDPASSNENYQDSSLYSSSLQAFAGATAGQDLAQYVSPHGTLHLVTTIGASEADPVFRSRHHAIAGYPHYRGEEPVLSAPIPDREGSSDTYDMVEHYTLVTVPLSHPSPRSTTHPRDSRPHHEPEAQLTASRLPRRDVYNEGPIHDSWSQLSLQRDDCIGDLCIVDVRKVWVAGQSKQRRFAAVVPWPRIRDDVDDDAAVADDIPGRPDPGAKKPDIHFDDPNTDIKPLLLSQVLFSGYLLNARAFVDVLSSSNVGVAMYKPCPRLSVRVAAASPTRADAAAAAALGHDKDGERTGNSDGVSPIGPEESLVADLYGAKAVGSRVACCHVDQDFHTRNQANEDSQRGTRDRFEGSLGRTGRGRIARPRFRGFLDEKGLVWWDGRGRGVEDGEGAAGALWWDPGVGLR